MNKILYILIFSILLFSSSDAEQGEIEYVIRPQFDGAWSFSEGLAAVKMGDRYGFINKQGQYVANPQFDIASSFSEGLAAVKIGDRYGYINKQGQYVINLLFDFAYSFSEGERRGFINKEGQFVIKAPFKPFKYGSPRGSFSEGLACVWVIGEGRGFINKEGYVINQKV